MPLEDSQAPVTEVLASICVHPITLALGFTVACVCAPLPLIAGIVMVAIGATEENQTLMINSAAPFTISAALYSCGSLMAVCCLCTCCGINPLMLCGIIEAKINQACCSRSNTEPTNGTTPGTQDRRAALLDGNTQTAYSGP